MTARLAGKVAIVTGASGGIGAAIAKRFSEEGASVVLTARRREPLEQVASAVNGTAVVGDARDRTHLEEAVNTAVNQFGSLDIIIANAATTEGSSLLELQEKDWQRTIDVNLTSALKLSQIALPQMISQGGGTIVNISSVAAIVAPPDSVSYSVSKAGMLALTRSLALDFGKHNIRVNSLCPGWVKTPMSDKAMAFLSQKHGVDQASAIQLATQHVPLKRMANPVEIANCCLFLASDEASFVTGTLLMADGGGSIVDVAGLAFHED